MQRRVQVVDAARPRPRERPHRRHRQTLRDDAVGVGDERADRAGSQRPRRRARTPSGSRSVSNGTTSVTSPSVAQLAREVEVADPGPRHASSRRGRSRRRRSCGAPSSPGWPASIHSSSSRRGRSSRARGGSRGAPARARANAAAIARGCVGRRSSSPATTRAAADGGRHLSAKRSRLWCDDALRRARTSRRRHARRRGGAAAPPGRTRSASRATTRASRGRGPPTP